MKSNQSTTLISATRILILTEKALGEISRLIDENKEQVIQAHIRRHSASLWNRLFRIPPPSRDEVVAYYEDKSTDWPLWDMSYFIDYYSEEKETCQHLRILAQHGDPICVTASDLAAVMLYQPKEATHG